MDYWVGLVRVGMEVGWREVGVCTVVVGEEVFANGLSEGRTTAAEEDGNRRHHG